MAPVSSVLDKLISAGPLCICLFPDFKVMIWLKNSALLWIQEKPLSICSHF